MRTVLRLLRLKYYATARSEASHRQGSVYVGLFHKSGTGWTKVPRDDHETDTAGPFRDNFP